MTGSQPASIGGQGSHLANTKRPSARALRRLFRRRICLPGRALQRRHPFAEEPKGLVELDILSDAVHGAGLHLPRSSRPTPLSPPLMAISIRPRCSKAMSIPGEGAPAPAPVRARLDRLKGQRRRVSAAPLGTCGIRDDCPGKPFRLGLWSPHIPSQNDDTRGTVDENGALAMFRISRWV